MNETGVLKAPSRSETKKLAIGALSQFVVLNQIVQYPIIALCTNGLRTQTVYSQPFISWWL